MLAWKSRRHMLYFLCAIFATVAVVALVHREYVGGVAAALTFAFCSVVVWINLERRKPERRRLFSRRAPSARPRWAWALLRVR